MTIRLARCAAAGIRTRRSSTFQKTMKVFGDSWGQQSFASLRLLSLGTKIACSGEADFDEYWRRQQRFSRKEAKDKSLGASGSTPAASIFLCRGRGTKKCHAEAVPNSLPDKTVSVTPAIASAPKDQAKADLC